MLTASWVLKFIYSEKATNFCEIFTLLLTTVHTVKGRLKILQNFVAHVYSVPPKKSPIEK